MMTDVQSVKTNNNFKCISHEISTLVCSNFMVTKKVESLCTLWLNMEYGKYSLFVKLVCFRILSRGGGGVLSLEKGTNCGPTAGELWLSQPTTAKKGGLSSYYIVG